MVHEHTPGCRPGAEPRASAAPRHRLAARAGASLRMYRQHQPLKRLGVDLSRTTLATGMVRAGALVVPLINLLREELLDRPYLLMDETTVQVLKEPGKGAQSKSQLWVQMSAGPPLPARGGRLRTAHRRVRLRPYPRRRRPQTLACRVHRRAAHRRLQRLSVGGARAGAGVPGVLGPCPARVHRHPQKPRPESEQAASGSAREEPAPAPERGCAVP